MRFLLACLAACGATPAAAAERFAPDIRPSRSHDWAQFLALVTRHRVAALALRGSERLALEAPHHVRQELELAKRATVGASLLQVRELILLLQRFTAAGIAALPLKGPALSQQLYGDPGLRQSKDIDLLIDAQALDRADALLAAAGYQRQHPAFSTTDARWPIYSSITQHADYHRPGGPALEIHWRLHPVASLYPVSAAALLTKAQRLPMAGAEIPVLAPAEQLLYLASHGARHTWSRLGWLADIPPLLALMNANQRAEAQRRANALGLQRPLALALRLSQQAFGGAIPAGFDGRALRDPAVDKMAAWARAAIEGPADHRLTLATAGLFYRDLRLQLQLKRSGRYKLACLRRLLLSTHDVETLRLPVAWTFLYIMLRPWCWIRRRIGHSIVAWQASRGSSL